MGPGSASFGKALKTYRLNKGLTLSEVARALRVSVVYYRDVENGQRLPFSSLRIDFDRLASLLGVDPDHLISLAAFSRGQLEFDFRSSNDQERALIVLFAGALRRRRLARADLRNISAVLKRRA